jgi:hypothetical protein
MNITKERLFMKTSYRFLGAAWLLAMVGTVNVHAQEAAFTKEEGELPIELVEEIKHQSYFDLQDSFKAAFDELDNRLLNSVLTALNTDLVTVDPEHDPNVDEVRLRVEIKFAEHRAQSAIIIVGVYRYHLNLLGSDDARFTLTQTAANMLVRRLVRSAQLPTDHQLPGEIKFEIGIGSQSYFAKGWTGRDNSLNWVPFVQQTRYEFVKQKNLRECMQKAETEKDRDLCLVQ